MKETDNFLRDGLGAGEDGGWVGGAGKGKGLESLVMGVN